MYFWEEGNHRQGSTGSHFAGEYNNQNHSLCFAAKLGIRQVEHIDCRC